MTVRDERQGRPPAGKPIPSPSVICLCGHPASAHDAPAGPCHLCPPPDAQHTYTQEHP